MLTSKCAAIWLLGEADFNTKSLRKNALITIIIEHTFVLCIENTTTNIIKKSQGSQ